MNSFWDFIWIVVASFFFVAYLMILFHIFGDIFRDGSLGGWGKALWSVFIIVMPLLGALVYLVARGSGMAQRSLAQAQEYQAQQAEYIRSVAGDAADPVSKVAQAKSLLDSGAITQQEFDAMKAKALA